MNARASAYFHFLLNDRDWQIPEGDVTQVEIHWGLVRVDGTYKPSFEAFKAVIADLTLVLDSLRNFEFYLHRLYVQTLTFYC
jgi:hypothetical protein